jgi:hypothetical protein
MPNEADIRISEIDAEMARLSHEREDLKSGSSVQCLKCKNEQVVGDTTMLVWKSYESPWGCTGGDYWYESSRGFVCHSCGNLVEQRLHKVGSPSDYLFHGLENDVNGKVTYYRSDSFWSANTVSLSGSWNRETYERIKAEISSQNMKVDRDTSTFKRDPKT